MFSQTVLFGLEVHPAVCALRRILPGTSFSLAFVCIFLMSGRYFRILKKEQRVSGLGAKYIDNRSQMIAFLCVFPMECIILLQWILYENPSVDENLLHCVFIDRNFPISFIFVYLLMIGSTAVSTLALRRSRVYFTSELRSTIVCCILSVMLGVAWTICGFLLTACYYVPVTGFLGILQGYIILVTILPIIVRGLFKDEEPFDATGFTDASSVADGTNGFTNPVSVYESPYDSPPLGNWKQEKKMQEVAVGGKEDESPM
ncbi:putative metabotropic glutamate receptor 3 [Apostichopus japonicus]|uniref:Putative metabotropic glutamate receptor 3 n=1 Tax=Stichopus japonicus TaxID=307972 RepID=A0A2G8KSP7_STIJA|nr:putative metabotropic glutamate receptor 3 [Apostichopus japonicus]